MKIFISWSNSPSKEIANAVKNFIDSIFSNKLATFLSVKDISAGANGFNEIRKNLNDCSKCILCLVRNNIDSLWMSYEAGAISMHESKDNTCPIIPILFESIGDDKFDHHPLHYIQREKFSKETMLHIVGDINSICPPEIKLEKNALERQFKHYWTSFNRSVDGLLRSHTVGGNNALNWRSTLDILREKHYHDPLIGETAKYDHGFERQDLYAVLLEHAKKRFLIFGRKNKKLFANDNRNFFYNLQTKLSQGFEFKCLFINPSSPHVENAQAVKNFLSRLSMCIKDAYDVIDEIGIKPDEVLRAYNGLRADEIIFVDNVVLFSHLRYDEKGIPRPLTDAPFEVTDISNPIGTDYKNSFDIIWSDAEKIDKNFIDKI
jgi:hypothetical protein